MELTTMTEHVKVFPELDDAVEWVEDQILARARRRQSDVKRWNSNDLELFSDHKEETLIDLEASSSDARWPRTRRCTRLATLATSCT
jgi:hypothetical protein